MRNLSFVLAISFFTQIFSQQIELVDDFKSKKYIFIEGVHEINDKMLIFRGPLSYKKSIVETYDRELNLISTNKIRKSNQNIDPYCLASKTIRIDNHVLQITKDRKTGWSKDEGGLIIHSYNISLMAIDPDRKLNVLNENEIQNGDIKFIEINWDKEKVNGFVSFTLTKDGEKKQVYRRFILNKELKIISKVDYVTSLIVAKNNYILVDKKLTKDRLVLLIKDIEKEKLKLILFEEDNVESWIVDFNQTISSGKIYCETDNNDIYLGLFYGNDENLLEGMAICKWDSDERRLQVIEEIQPESNFFSSKARSDDPKHNYIALSHFSKYKNEFVFFGYKRTLGLHSWFSVDGFFIKYDLKSNKLMETKIPFYCAGIQPFIQEYNGQYSIVYNDSQKNYQEGAKKIYKTELTNNGYEVISEYKIDNQNNKEKKIIYGRDKELFYLSSKQNYVFTTKKGDKYVFIHLYFGLKHRLGTFKISKRSSE